MRVWRREKKKEEVWNFIFDSAQPKWQPVSGWKNNEPGKLAHHFKERHLFAIRQQSREESPARPRSPRQSAVVRKLLSRGLPLGEQSGTSPYECTAAAVACRLNASAESLSGMQLYKRNDEIEFLSWLEVSGCDPYVMTSTAEAFLHPVACV